jgi:hypothetical protein
MSGDDYHSHLVAVGGIDWNVLTRRLLDMTLSGLAQRTLCTEANPRSSSADRHDGMTGTGHLDDHGL